MQLKSLIPAIVLALAFPVAFAQQTDPGPKQDMKNAGSETKHAASSAGHGISSGTRKGYHKTVSGTKKGYHKTAHATKTGVRKVEGKPTPPQ